MIHVDDFLCVGNNEDLIWLRERLREKYELKAKIIGRDPVDLKEACFLNRVINIHPRGASVEGDPKHVKILLDEWNMNKCNGTNTYEHPH